MAMTASDYLAQLQALLPSGLAWSRQAEGALAKFLSAWADEFARVEARTQELIAEADPRTTFELLADWERVAGLPDVCVTIAQTYEQRIAALVSKLTATGGQSRQYFIDLAAAFGYPGATIDEFSMLTCNDDCNGNLYGLDAVYAWRVNLAASTSVYTMTCNSDCISSLQSWGNEAIECRISHLKPAHTTVLFAYS